MMKHLLFTSAIALFSVFTFAQNGNYGSQRNGGAPTGGQGSYQKGANTTQPFVQQPATNYTQNNGNYNNAQPTNSYPNKGSYESGNNQSTQQPTNNYNPSRNYDNHQMPQRQPGYDYQQHGYDHRYVPVYHQPAYRRDYRYEQHRGHDHFDAHGNYWY